MISSLTSCNAETNVDRIAAMIFIAFEGRGTRKLIRTEGERERE